MHSIQPLTFLNIFINVELIQSKPYIAYSGVLFICSLYQGKKVALKLQVWMDLQKVVAPQLLFTHTHANQERNIDIPKSKAVVLYKGHSCTPYTFQVVMEV